MTCKVAVDFTLCATLYVCKITLIYDTEARVKVGEKPCFSKEDHCVVRINKTC